MNHTLAVKAPCGLHLFRYQFKTLLVRPYHNQ